jgi:hypothetical protein
MLPVTMDKVRYLNKNNNTNERENYSKWWKEQIEQYGTRTSYYTHGYSLTSHNFLYGEDPTSMFLQVPNVIMITDITNDSLMLSKFGIMADCDMTAVVHISSFYEKFGCGFEPKAGDLIQLTEYGADRPGGRSAPIYEITERDDEYLPMTNPLIGHYVWYIKCKRYEYSYEPGLRTGPNNKQISDNGDYGRLAGGENEEELFQPYPDSVQNSAKCIYDYYSEDESSLNQDPNHYIPPAKPTCPTNLTSTSLNNVPGPYEVATNLAIPFDLQEMLRLGQEAAVMAPNVMFVQNLTENPDNIDTFVITTSAKPEDGITYTTEQDGPVDLRKPVLDGGLV